MFKRIIYVALVLLVVYNSYIYFNAKLNSSKNKFEKRLSTYNSVIKNVLQNGVVCFKDFKLIDSYSKENSTFEKQICDSKTLVLKVSERNCSDCNKKIIDRIDGYCRRMNIPLLVLVSDSRNPVIVKKKYKRRCYLINDSINNENVIDRTIVPLLFIVTEELYGYGFIKILNNKKDVLLPYLNIFDNEISQANNDYFVSH